MKVPENVDEIRFMVELLHAISAPNRATRVWRQNVGTVVKRDRRGDITGVFHAGPPKGASDLSGMVEPEGWRLEVEVKGAKTKHTREQKLFGAWVRRSGGVHVVIRYDANAPFEANVARGVNEVDAAIATRRAGGTR